MGSHVHWHSLTALKPSPRRPAPSRLSRTLCYPATTTTTDSTPTTTTASMTTTNSSYGTTTASTAPAILLRQACTCEPPTIWRRRVKEIRIHPRRRQMPKRDSVPLGCSPLRRDRYGNRYVYIYVCDERTHVSQRSRPPTFPMSDSSLVGWLHTVS